jgi:hypothetical protein
MQPQQGKQRPILRYAALAPVFVAALIYQVRFTVGKFPWWFGQHDIVAYPFLIVSDPAVRQLVIYSLSRVPDLKNGEPVLAIDGRPLTGTAVFGEALNRHRPGDLLSVTVEESTKSGRSERVVRVPLQAARMPSSALGQVAVLLLLAILPMFCLILGF